MILLFITFKTQNTQISILALPSYTVQLSKFNIWKIRLPAFIKQPKPPVFESEIFSVAVLRIVHMHVNKTPVQDPYVLIGIHVHA